MRSAFMVLAVLTVSVIVHAQEMVPISWGQSRAAVTTELGPPDDGAENALVYHDQHFLAIEASMSVLFSDGKAQSVQYSIPRTTEAAWRLTVDTVTKHYGEPDTTRYTGSYGQEIDAELAAELDAYSREAIWQRPDAAIMVMVAVFGSGDNLQTVVVTDRARTD